MDDYHLDDLDFAEVAEFDQQTQARLDAAVDRLLKGYDWTLQPLANKYALFFKDFFIVKLVIRSYL